MSRTRHAFLWRFPTLPWNKTTDTMGCSRDALVASPCCVVFKKDVHVIHSSSPPAFGYETTISNIAAACMHGFVRNNTVTYVPAATAAGVGEGDKVYFYIRMTCMYVPPGVLYHNIMRGTPQQGGAFPCVREKSATHATSPSEHPAAASSPHASLH